MLTGLGLVSEAADFAARRHTGQQRKGRGNEPYVNHLAEVANLLSIATDGTDAELAAAGWLHDTIEDTATARAETSLWRHLKAHRLAALGFRRQSPVGNYIADFVARSRKLVVEIDRESHDFDERIRHDARRDRWFASRGYRVLRFTNDEVMKNLEGVVLAISQAAEQAAPPSLTLPRKRGGNRARRAASTAKGDQ